MSTFNLTIVTPDGLKFSGEAERIRVVSTEGGVEILPHHINYATSLGMGPAYITKDGERRCGACIGGMLSVTNNNVRVIATTFEWSNEIDKERAKAALDRAEAKLQKSDLSAADKELALAAKQRAQVRLGCADE